MVIKYWFLIAITIIVALMVIRYFYFAKKQTNNSNQSCDVVNLYSNDQFEKKLPHNLVYPISDSSKRITANVFGQNWPAGGKTNPDIAVCPDATYYTGYHTANDLEIFANEQNAEVPVYAVAAGTIKQAGSVSGYGGLIVLESKINEQVYTIYYGHVDLATRTVSVGDTVSAGQKLAELAPACSAANGNVRKHLHFGIHTGNIIDVRGYVSNQSDLAAWVNPSILLSQNYASDPVTN